MGRILAIDFGRKRTGLAVTDSLRITANPLITIPTHTLEAWLTEYFSKETVDEVVIGHPYQMNGDDSESMQYIQPFINRFRKVFPTGNQKITIPSGVKSQRTPFDDDRRQCSPAIHARKPNQ